IEAADPRAEANALALILREAAETGTRAALVTPDRMLTRRVAAVFGFGVWLLSAIYYTLPANLEPHMSLPIQTCDLLVLLAPLTLWRPSRLLRSVVYFGGFALTTQAFVTPTSDVGGPDHIKFWIFWLLHGVILATAIYLVAVDRFRPTIRDLRNAVAFWFVYAAAMIALNYATYLGDFNDGNGWYYGYLGPTLPEVVQGSVLRHLGDWPLRPLLMMLLALSIFVLCYLPWLLIPRRDEAQRESSDQSSSAPSS
ncbi:MAG: TIGR02206 family membrane protein, partial [Phycisphaeraceae bacterium]